MSSDTARPVPRPGAPRRRRLHLPGWSVLVVLFGGFGLLGVHLASGSDLVADVTVATWRCPHPVGEQMGWAELEAAGCAADDLGAEVVLFERQGRKEPADVAGGRHTFRAVGTLTPELSLQVDLPQPASAVVLASRLASGPELLTEMNGDASGTRWTSHLNADGNDTFLLLVGYAPQ